MQEIDFNTWERKEHFQFFHRMDYPQFNLTFNLDITGFLPYIKKNNFSFYYSMIYYSMLAVNKIREFKYRIREGKPVLHDIIHPSFTDLNKNDTLFKIVTVEMQDSLEAFLQIAAKQSREQKEYFPPLTVKEKDNLVYITCLPWMSFTQFSHSITLNRDDSAPRLSWGKYFCQENKHFLPFSVQVNHALADGYHVGKYKKLLEDEINNLTS